MISGLDPITIKELEAHSIQKFWAFNCFIDGIKSISGIKGELKAQIEGNYLYIQGDFTTQIKLRCDRCLNNFNRELKVKEHESILIKDESSEDIFKNFLDKNDDLLEKIRPGESFDPQRWIFEQLSLQLPVVNICGDKCPGLPTQRSDKSSNESNSAIINEETTDPRWAPLKNLRPI